jgi:hypothetical protein
LSVAGRPIVAGVFDAVAEFLVGHQTGGAVEDTQVGVTQMLGQPVGVDQQVAVRRVGPRICHARCLS